MRRCTVALVALTLVAGCQRACSSSPETGAPGNALSGSVVAPARHLVYAVYTDAPVAMPDLSDMRTDAAARFKGLPFLHTFVGAEAPFVAVEAPDIAKFAPPDAKHLTRFGHGLSDDQRAQATRATGVVVATFRLASDPGMQRARDAEAFALASAKLLHGFVWDELTRELFTVEAFEAHMSRWRGALPEVPSQVVIHYYAHGETNRAVTLGMEKFGAPDVVIQDVPQPLASGARTVMNTAAQLLVEGASLDHGKLVVDLTAIRHTGVRDALRGLVKEGARPITVTLTPAERQQGDEDNRQLALTFDPPAAFSGGVEDHAPETEFERQAAALKTFYGGDVDPVSQVREGDAELAAVTRDVQKKLPALAARFKAGLPVGDALSVKAPFTTSGGGTEWMWVHVESWPDSIHGLLDSDPLQVPELHRGSKVTIAPEKVADYVLMHADGTHEGGESAKILERREGPR